LIDFQRGVHLKPLENVGLLKWRNDPEVWRWTRQNDLINEAQHEKWFEGQSRDPKIRMYCVHNERTSVGVCGFTSIDPWNRHAEFSLYIGPEGRNGGFGRMALETLFYHGFKNMGLNLIWGETFENNPAQKLFKKIGMVEEGRRRQFYFKDGKLWDALLFSVTGQEFIAKHGEASCFG